ncbi:MAG: hypothetical protein R2715_05975 [Ilumatobacteraceae bacterium]
MIFTGLVLFFLTFIVSRLARKIANAGSHPDRHDRSARRSAAATRSPVVG